jgi:O-antigen ligase
MIDLKGPIESWKNPIRPAVQTNGVGYIDWFTAGQTRYQFDAGIIGDGFGSFIYSNHFAAAASVTLPFVLAWIVILLRGRVPRIAVTGFVLSATAAAVWTAGALAHSRAGSVALLLASMVFLALSATNRWSRLLAIVCAGGCAIGMCALAVILYGKIEGVTELFPHSLQQTITGLTADSRAQATAASLRIFAASPVAGTGLGTYSLVFPRVAPGGYVFYFAHNDYAQWLAETGIIGMLLASGAAAWLACRAWRSPRKDTPNDSLMRAAAYGAVAGIASHSLFDWNLHIPANAFLACVALGLALREESADRLPATVRPAATPKGFTGTVIFAIGCFGALIVLGREAVSEATQRQLRTALVAAQMAVMDASRPPPIQLLKAASAAGERMLRWDSANAQLNVLAGQAHAQLAVLTQDPASRDSHAEMATRCFRAAKRSNAMVRGIPEPLVISKPAASSR